MIIDRFVKRFQVQTSNAPSQIINEIEFRSERQQKSRLLLMNEPINYRSATISENYIVFKRGSNFYNRLRGVGKIILTLEPNTNGTLITCEINPTLNKMLIDLAFILITLAVITIIIFKDITQIYISTIVFILLTWIIGLLVGYFSLKFNTINLESYAHMILQDLNITSENK
jgi:hypothetical protein